MTDRNVNQMNAAYSMRQEMPKYLRMKNLILAMLESALRKRALKGMKVVLEEVLD